jgi:hypothetical protein
MILTVKRIPDCEFCEDEGVYNLDFQMGEDMRSISHKCICQVEKNEVKMSVLSPMQEIVKTSEVMTQMRDTPVIEMAWSTGRIISTTLPSASMRF